MEILDYLRAKGSQLAVLVGLPFLAGAMTFYLLADRPPRYESELQIVVPDVLASGASGLGLYVANFRQALISPQVVERVAATTEAREEDLRDGLEVTQVGQANRMELRWVTDSAGLAPVVPRIAAEATLEAMAAADAGYQRRALAVADERYEEARAEIDRFRSESGLLFPEEEYRIAGEQLRGLEEQLADAEASGFTVTAASMRAQVETARARRDALGPQLLFYEGLEVELENANSTRRAAEADVVEAEAQLDLARSPELLSEVQTDVLAPGQTLLAGVALAAGVAFLLGLGILAAPDVLRRRTVTRQAPAGRRRTASDEEWLGVYAADDVLVESRRSRTR